MDREPPLRVVVADDEPIVTKGLVSVLEDGGFEVTGVAADAEELLRQTRAQLPDVVITDIQMPPDLTDDGLRAAAQIRSELPEIGVLVLSHFLEERYPLELVGDRAEGVGYLLKERVGDLVGFTEAVRCVGNGGSVLDPAVVHTMVGRQASHDPLETLTDREGEVLELMAEGRSNQGIADALVVTVPVVERNVSSIFHKLGLRPESSDHRRVLAVLEHLRR